MRGGGWCDDKMARVMEYWRMIERDRLLGLFENGSVHVITKENMGELFESHGQPIRTRIAPCSYAQMHLVTGWKILSGPYEWQIDRLPIIRMIGRSITAEGKRYRYGLVRFMKDPSRLRNFWRSVAAEQLGYAPKAQWIAPESAVAGREKEFRKAHLTRDPLLIYNDDATAPPQRLEPPTPQMALLNEAQVNSQDMKDVTGIHDASLGIRSNETSGKAIMARQKEGDVASITYYDNGNASILEGGAVINQLLGQIYDGTRIARGIGEDDAPKLIKINDPMDSKSPNLAASKYDVILTTGTSYTTRRAEAADAMMNAIQVWPEIMGIAGDLVVKSQDWPGAQELAERIKKTIPPHLIGEGEEAPQDPQQAAMLQQAMQAMSEQLQAVTAENESLKTNQMIDIGKLKIDEYNAETKRMAVQDDGDAKEGSLMTDLIKTGMQHEARKSASLSGQNTPSLNARVPKQK
jgi:hypothetical protein